MDSLNILVVDDDMDFAESVGESLELYGHSVDLAYTCDQAVNKFKNSQYNMVFLDVRLPGKNGLECYLEIRELNPHIKVVMMTGYSVESILNQAIDEGAWAVLHKPLDMRHVLGLTNKVKPQGILIADDDPDFVDSLRESLIFEGYKVSVAFDGQSALDKIKLETIDVLILDFRMPKLNGLEVYIELLNSGNKVPTLIMTAFAKEETESLEKLAAMNVSAIINKPFSTHELISHLNSIIANPTQAS